MRDFDFWGKWGFNNYREMAFTKTKITIVRLMLIRKL
jgi:hypothetical protein